MDNIPEVTPHRKRRFTLTCVLSVSYNSSLEITKSILETYLVTLIDRCKKRKYYKDRKLTEFTDSIENISVVGIIK